MTRADRIRSMTDRELGGWLYPLVAGMDSIPFCTENERCGELLDGDGIPEEMCIGCLIAYLQQPEESENTEKIHEKKETNGQPDPGRHCGPEGRNELRQI